MAKTQKAFIQMGMGALLFFAGLAIGAAQSHTVSAQNKFGRPKTVIHVVVYKFRDGVSEAEQKKVLDGIPVMAAKISGVKNVWTKTARNQIRDFSGVYAIEFTGPEAAADYAESPVHEAWSKQWQQLRENSLSFQVTNP